MGIFITGILRSFIYFLSYQISGFFWGLYKIRSAQVAVSKVARSLATLTPG